MMTIRSRFFSSSSGSAVEAVEVGHLDVEHDDVGIGAQDLIDRIAAGAQRGDDLEARLLVDPARDEAAHHDRVVDDHDANGVVRRGGRGRRKGGGNAHALYSDTLHYA